MSLHLAEKIVHKRLEGNFEENPSISHYKTSLVADFMCRDLSSSLGRGAMISGDTHKPDTDLRCEMMRYYVLAGYQEPYLCRLFAHSF